jgi:hypothetical protein
LSRIIVCIFLAAKLYSQWINIYNSPYNDQSLTNSIAINSAGNIYSSGYLWTTAETNEDDFLLIKYGLSGDTVFTRTFNILGEDEAAAVAVDRFDNVYVAGKSENPSVYDIVLLKYSPLGTLLWQRSFNGSSNRLDEPCCIVTDDSSNVYIAGKSQTSISQYNTVIIKYNSSGVLQWVKVINLGSAGVTIPAAISLSKTTGNLYVTGYYITGTVNEIFTLKINTGGTQQWLKMLSPPSVISSTGTSIALDNQENVFVCGKANINNSPGFITLKYNSAGDSMWSKTYTVSPSNTEDCAYGICADSAGNSYVTGKSFLGSGNVQFEIVTISYNPSGTQRWISHYNRNMSAINNIPVQILLNRSNKPVICAFSTGTSGYFDFLCIKLTNNGQQEGEQRYHAAASQDNVPSAMCIDNNSDIYFTGYLFQGYPKAVTVKFADNLFGIQRIGTEVPDKFLLYQNYPNPFNPVTNINFQIPNPAFVKLEVVDLLGREIETLIYEHLNPGVYKTEWNALNYSSGVYFYRMRAGDFADVKKMIVIK